MRTLLVAMLAGLASALGPASIASAAALPATIMPIASTVPMAHTFAADELLLATKRGRGFVIEAVPATGGTAALRASFPAASHEESSVESMDATPTMVAIAMQAAKRGTRRYRSAVLTGPPEGPFSELKGTAEPAASGFELDWVGISGDRVLTFGYFSPENTRLRLFAPGAAPRVVGSKVNQAAAGPTAYAYSNDKAVVIVDAAGTRTIPLKQAGFDVAHLEVTDGGSVLVQYRDDLLVIAPGATRPTRTRRNVFGDDFNFAAAGNDGVLLSEDTFDRDATDPPQRLRVVQGDAPARTLGPISPDLFEYATDGERVVWSTAGCVVLAPLSGPPLGGLPEGPCARSHAFLFETSAPFTTKSKKVPVTVGCLASPPEGCAGTVTVTLDTKPTSRARSAAGAGQRVRLARVPYRAGLGERTRVDPALSASRRRVLARALKSDSAAIAIEIATKDPEGRVTTTGARFFMAADDS